MKRDDELGRRILAALISHQMGYSGVDRTLKELRKRSIAPSWAELGMALLHRIQDERDAERLKTKQIKLRKMC